MNIYNSLAKYHETMKQNLNAVHDEDLKTLLKRLNLYDKVVEGKLKCKFTETVITVDNLHSIFPESGKIKMVCDSPEAIRMLSEYINDQRP